MEKILKEKSFISRIREYLGSLLSAHEMINSARATVCFRCFALPAQCQEHKVQHMDGEKWNGIAFGFSLKPQIPSVLSHTVIISEN